MAVRISPHDSQPSTDKAKLYTDSKINVRITAFLYLPFYQEKIKPRQSSLQEEIYFNSYS